MIFAISLVLGKQAEANVIGGVWGPHPSLLLGHLTSLSLSLGLLGLCIFTARVEKRSFRDGRATPPQVTLIVKEQGGLHLRLKEAEESLVTHGLIHGV